MKLENKDKDIESQDKQNGIINYIIGSDESKWITHIQIGGINKETAYRIQVDKLGCTYITGTVDGSVFPTTEGAYQSTYGGNLYDGFVSKLDSDGGVYITGETGSSNFPITQDAYQTTLQGYNSVFVSKLTPVEYDFIWYYKQNSIKLLDTITTKLSINNLGSTDIDVNIKFQSIDDSVLYVPKTLKIQNINQSLSTIPEEIYISNIVANEKAEISLDLKYVKEKFPEMIPIIVEIEVYYNKLGTITLAEDTVKDFYIDTGIGPNYMHGCEDIYNLEINGKLQRQVYQ